MTLDTYPKLTNATSDREIVRLWISMKAKSTQKTYVTVSRQFLEFTGKELKATMLEDILLWLESFQLRGASQNTVSNKLAAIKSLFSFGVKTGYLRANPASMIKTIKAKETLNERILTEEDVKKLIAAAKNECDLPCRYAERNRLILIMLYLLGLRISELVGLNWSDFQPTKSGEIAVTFLGKGSKTRTLLIDKLVWKQLLLLPKSDKCDAVFLSRFNNRLDRHAIHRMIKDASIRAGINPKVSAHWLRHSHSTHSLNNGADIELLMKSLGHSSLAVTSKYLHVQPMMCTSKFINLD